jgi:hypothetical protein
MSVETSEAARILSMIAAEKRRQFRLRAGALEILVQRQQAIIDEYRLLFTALKFEMPTGSAAKD